METGPCRIYLRKGIQVVADSSFVVVDPIKRCQVSGLFRFQVSKNIGFRCQVSGVRGKVGSASVPTIF